MRFSLPVFTAVLSATALFGPTQSASFPPTTNFWIHCLPVRVATIDPIVAPGSVTTSHYHVFFGNTMTDQNSSPGSLRAAGVGATTCTDSTDTAAYWAPQLELLPGEKQSFTPAGFPCVLLPSGNQACTYTNIRAYYSTSGTARSALSNVPSGEEALGGNQHATGPQPTTQVTFSCGGSTPFEQYPYDCTPYINNTGNNDQDGVVARAIFPRCWDGTGTSPADFAYPPCGGAFPKILPLINVRFHTGVITPCPGMACPAGSKVTPRFGFRMADDSLMPWYDFHADFMNGWQYAPQDNPGGLDDLVHDCLMTASPCPVNPRTSPAPNMPT